LAGKQSDERDALVGCGARLKWSPIFKVIARIIIFPV
jgi:hypothetical protein